MQGLVVVVMVRRMRWRGSKGGNGRAGRGSLLGVVSVGGGDRERRDLPDFVAK